MRLIEVTVSATRKVAGRPLKDYESKDFFLAAKAEIETGDEADDAIRALGAVFG